MSSTKPQVAKKPSKITPPTIDDGSESDANATFIYWTAGCMHYLTARGIVPDGAYNRGMRARPVICEANGGKMPGLLSNAFDKYAVIHPDDKMRAPILLKPGH